MPAAATTSSAWLYSSSRTSGSIYTSTSAHVSYVICTSSGSKCILHTSANTYCTTMPVLLLYVLSSHTLESLQQYTAALVIQCPAVLYTALKHVKKPIKKCEYKALNCFVIVNNNAIILSGRVDLPCIHHMHAIVKDSFVWILRGNLI